MSNMTLGSLFDGSGGFPRGWSYLKEPMVTHWMPLPEPPEALIKEN